MLAAPTSLAVAGGASAQSQRPKVLPIMTDQQVIWAFSAKGNPYLDTPSMDCLVDDGVSCTESDCTYPVGSPVRSSVMTGLMPHATGVMKSGKAIADGIPNIGEHFRAEG